MNIEETKLCNQITVAIEDKAQQQGLHHFMPRITNIVVVPDRSVKEYHCIYTFTTVKDGGCLQRDFGFGIDILLETDIDKIADRAIKIIKC